MKILKVDRKENYIEIVPENLDDFWHLEKVIEKGDIVSGSTTRKIKGKEEGAATRRERLYIEIQVENVEYHKFSGQLRVNGIILGGKPEALIELKAHHALEVELNEKLKVRKQKLKEYQIERLEKAKAATHREKVLIVIMDDEAADFAFLKDFGVEFKLRIGAEKAGKRYKSEEAEKKFFAEVLKKIHELNAKKIVIAGPGFTKENFKKYLEEKSIELKAFYLGINSVGATGFNELIKSGLLNKVTAEMEMMKESKLVQEFMAELGKNSGLTEYGFEEVNKAVDLGAVAKLLVAESKLQEEREKAEELMDKAEGMKAEVHIIADEHEAGKTLSGFGGIVALLRYRTKFD